MKSAVILAVLIGAAFGAPTEDIEEIKRTKKSPSYGAPCGAPLAPVALYLAQTGGQIPHYRENEHEEHNTQHARSYYEAPAAALAPAGLAGLSLQNAGAGGPAVGLFPNAKLGGCAVPLLLSCAPNVVSGHLSHQGYGSPAAYRTLEHEHKMREVVPENSWSESERSNQVNPAEIQEAKHGHQLSHSTGFQPAQAKVTQNMKH